MPEKLTEVIRDIAFDAMCVWEWAQDMLAKESDPIRNVQAVDVHPDGSLTTEDGRFSPPDAY